MNSLNGALALGAGAVLILGLVSGHIKNRLWFSEPVVAMLIGIVAGPLVLDLVDPDLSRQSQNTLMHEAARFTLAISVMGAALRLPYAYVFRHWREVVVILGPGMLLMWLASSVVVYLVLGLPVLVALLVGAVLTPTDPVLADSIVTGRTAERYVPGRLRYAISVESGANDGLALPLVMLPVLLMQHQPGEAAVQWLDQIVLRQLLLGAAVGLVIGWTAGRCLRWTYEHPLSERASILSAGLALALTVLAVDRLLGTAAILAVFLAGLIFNRTVSAREDARHERVQEAIGRFFDIPIFIFFGVVLPWQEWLELGLIALPLVLIVLALRRLPTWFLLSPLMPSLRSRREVLFNGWFGPIGIGALFYATDVRHKIEQGDTVWAVATLVVFGSIILHGITATPLTKLYGRHARPAETMGDEPEPEEEEEEEERARAEPGR